MIFKMFYLFFFFSELKYLISTNWKVFVSSSRLGCQVILENFMDGMEIRLPSETVDYRTKEN